MYFELGFCNLYNSDLQIYSTETMENIFRIQHVRRVLEYNHCESYLALFKWMVHRSPSAIKFLDFESRLCLDLACRLKKSLFSIVFGRRHSKIFTICHVSSDTLQVLKTKKPKISNSESRLWSIKGKKIKIYILIIKISFEQVMGSQITLVDIQKA